jgi:tetratricopeptide (TPR) repeat protein
MCGFVSVLKAKNKDTTLIHDGLYTYDALDNKIEGKIYLSFTVDAEGNIIKESVSITRGLGYGMDELAVNTLKKNPPKLTGRGQNIRYTLPIVIALSAVKDKEWSEYYTIKGGKFIEQKQYDFAIDCYNKAIEKNKKNYKALYGLSEAYKAKGDSTNSRIYLEKAYKKGYKS